MTLTSSHQDSLSQPSLHLANSHQWPEDGSRPPWYQEDSVTWLQLVPLPWTCRLGSSNVSCGYPCMLLVPSHLRAFALLSPFLENSSDDDFCQRLLLGSILGPPVHQGWGTCTFLVVLIPRPYWLYYVTWSCTCLFAKLWAPKARFWVIFISIYSKHALDE